MRSGKIGTSSMDNGRYRLTGLLGAGGMAVVYSAFDTMLKVKRAIKVLNDQYAKNEKIRQRFLAEAQIMAQLRHPNIVSIYDIGMEEGSPYIVMELVEGGSLQGYISSVGSYTAPLAARLVQGALTALQFAHDNGVIHRDFKPHNILLTLEGVPKLTDFGVAQVAGSDHSLTKTGAVMGTLAYMAPEQRMNAKESSVEVDVFAAGSSLYSMIKGSHSFDLYSTEFHNRIFEGLKSDIRNVIVKACQYEPSERYPSASAMAEALDPISKALGEEEWINYLAHIDESKPKESGMDFVPEHRERSLDTFALDDGHSTSGVDSDASLVNQSLLEGDPHKGIGRSRRIRSVMYGGVFLALALSVYIWGGKSHLADVQGTSVTTPPVPSEIVELTIPVVVEPDMEPVELDLEQGIEEAASVLQQISPTVEEDLAVESSTIVEAVHSDEGVVPVPPDNQVVEPGAVTSDVDGNPSPNDSGIVDTATPIELVPLIARINTVPASQLSIDGEDVGPTRWSGELSPGEHTLEMTASDGRVQQTEITVSGEEEYSLCWSFDSEGPCSRSRRVRERNRRRSLGQ